MRSRFMSVVGLAAMGVLASTLLSAMSCSSVVVEPGPTEDLVVTTEDPTTPDDPDPTPTDDPDPIPPDETTDTVTQFEQSVLDLVNEQRAAGADCGSSGSFPATNPVTKNALLQDAARAHSNDMADRDFFSHTNPDGDGPGDRIAATGYSFSTWGENIAYGQSTPEQVVDAWMNSPGHCANIMRSSYTEIGVGYNEENIWTQVFAAPAGQ